MNEIVVSQIGGAAAGVEVSAASASSNPSLGDTILSGIDSMRSSYHEKVQAINSEVSGVGTAEMKMEDAVRLQVDLMQLHMQQDLTAKIADKSSQGLQTLFRNQ